MKINSTINYRCFLNRITLAIAITGLLCCFATAQDQSQHQGKSEATIELSYYKKADMTKTAVAIVKVRKDKKFVPAKNARVNFYVLHDKEQQLITIANTDNKGKAAIALQNGLPLDEGGSFTIVAKIENDSLYEDVEEKIHYKEANLSLSINPRDTTRLVTAKVTEIGKDGKEMPVKDADLKFYVQRLFGIMPAAEDYTIKTDEKGEASFTFPKNIPGDTAGGISVVARMEDNELFGNVENSAKTFGGTPLAIERTTSLRALWEPHAPLPLIIIIATIFGGVWCTYFFIFFQLRKIKEGDDNL